LQRSLRTLQRSLRTLQQSLCSSSSNSSSSAAATDDDDDDGRSFFGRFFGGMPGLLRSKHDAVCTRRGAPHLATFLQLIRR